MPEPYYVPNGNEAQPKPVGEDCGIIVYQYYPISAVNYVRNFVYIPFFFLVSTFFFGTV